MKGKLQKLQNRAARSTAKLRYEDADHAKLLSGFGWLNVRNLIAYDLGVFMLKIMNNLAPEDIVNSFPKRPVFINMKPVQRLKGTFLFHN